MSANKPMFDDGEKKKTPPKKAEKKTIEYEYEAEVHLPGDDQPKSIKLTKDDLDPKKDKNLKPLYDLIGNADLAKYFSIPFLRGLANFVSQNEKSFKIDYANYKKKGRI